MLEIKKINLVAVILFALVFSSCAKKNDSPDAGNDEKNQNVTKENYLDIKLNAYLSEYPDFPGFYTDGLGKINEVRPEEGKLYYIEYAFENDEYVEAEKSEIFMGYYSYPEEHWEPSIYLGPGEKNMNALKVKGKRYENMEEAVMANYKHNYGPYVAIKSVTASSSLGEKYPAENLIDGTYMSWAEGEEGSGIGCRIEIEFKRPHFFDDYTNYACIDIVNGFGDVKYFHQNNRVKDMNLWIDDEPEPVKITLFDRHREQTIVLRKYLGNRFVKKLTFEILSVYPGTKYDDTCIAEIHIGPFDWNSETMPLDPYEAELLYAYYRDFENASSIYRFKNDVLEYHDVEGRDPTGEWVTLPMMPGNYRQVEFDFDGDTPILIKPGKVQNQDDIDANWTDGEEMGQYSCEPFFSDYKLYAYKNGGWKEYKNPELTAEIDKAFAEQSGKYFTFRELNAWSDLYSGVNDGEDPNYSIDRAWFQKNICFNFYDEKHVIFRNQKESFEGLESWWYKFSYDGKKYVLEKSE